MSSFLGNFLLSDDIDKALAAVEHATPSIDVPIHFPINLYNSHWTQATVHVSNAKATYTDCLRNGPPSKSKASLRAFVAKKRAGSNGGAQTAVSVVADYATMPEQDDTHSCGPLALCVMLLRAAGRRLSMKAGGKSEVRTRLRAIMAAIAAKVTSAEEGGGLLQAL